MISKKLPAYWEEYLQEKINKVRAWKKLAGEGGFCVAMITDFHWQENEKYSISMLERVLCECDIPYFFQAGDVVSGAGICTKESILEELEEYKKAFALFKKNVCARKAITTAHIPCLSLPRITLKISPKPSLRRFIFPKYVKTKIRYTPRVDITMLTTQQRRFDILF